MNKRIWFVAAGMIFLVLGIGSLLTYLSPRYDQDDNLKGKTLSAVELRDRFLKDEETASETYFGQFLELKGQVTDVNADQVIVDEHIICDFDEGEAGKIIRIGQGKEIFFHGRCVSWDSLFENVRMDACKLIEP